MALTKLPGYTLDPTKDFTFSSNVSLGNVSNIHISGGTANTVLTTDGNGNLSWAQGGSGGSTRAVAMTMGIIFGG